MVRTKEVPKNELYDLASNGNCCCLDEIRRR